MDTILQMAGWKLFFGVNTRDQPMHIHAEKGNLECKFWIDDDNFEIRPALEYNLTPEARRTIKKIIYEHFDYIVSEWVNALKKSE